MDFIKADDDDSKSLHATKKDAKVVHLVISNVAYHKFSYDAAYHRLYGGS